jgi:hypothetical protein
MKKKPGRGPGRRGQLDQTQDLTALAPDRFNSFERRPEFMTVAREPSIEAKAVDARRRLDIGFPRFDP